MNKPTHVNPTVALLAALIWAAAAFGAPVSFETAQNVAQKQLERTGNGKIKPAQRGPLLKTITDTAAPPYFVIEKENGGFIIISADDIAVPILGETNNGAFDNGNMPPAMRWLLKTYEEQITEAVKNGAAQDGETKELWKQAMSNSGLAAAASYIKDTLLTMWHQNEPYWNNTPKTGTSQTVTGCVATVMAQIMNYYKYPARTSGAIPSYISGSRLSVSALPVVAFDWANTRDKYGYYPSADGTHQDSDGNRYRYAEWNSVQGQAVATLMNAAGRAVKTDYGTESSGAYSIDAAKALLRYFDYDGSIIFISSQSSGGISASDWKELVVGQMENSSPIYYSGVNANDGVGHAFVIDGYNGNSGLFHLNWGWNGRYNGFFPLTALNPNSKEQFNSKQEMIINIMPNKGGSPPSQIKASKFDVAVSTAEQAVSADIRAKMNYGVDFDGKIGLAVMSGGEVKRVLDSTSYSISNTYDPELGKYTVNYKNAALKWKYGANTAQWIELSGNQTVQLVTKRRAGAWTPTGETKTVSIPHPKNYTVSFDLDGGSGAKPENINVTHGSTLGEERKPSMSGFKKEGYTHDGKWYARTGGQAPEYVYTEFVFGPDGTQITGDITLYAKWTINTYTVTFDANGGTVTQSAGTTGEGWKLASLPTPSRDGYFFGGWFTERAGGTEVTANTAFSRNAVVYAKWKISPVIFINGSTGGANPRVGDTLTAGVAVYVWKLGGASAGAPNKPYVVTADDIGGAIALEITESGDVYSVKTAPVMKDAGPERPNRPDIEYVTYSSVKLPETPGGEYSMDSVKWQKSAVFSGLTPNTRYTFYQRAAETKTAYASPASFGREARTDALTVQSLYKAVFIKLRNRTEVPEVQPAEAAAAAPAERLADGFTAGPNPVVRRGGSLPPVINFYRHGTQAATCELRIYDANGNVINKITVSDNARNTSARRKAGSWDLTDKNGRQVPEGTYLVRGAVKTRDGKKEKVSLIIGIR